MNMSAIRPVAALSGIKAGAAALMLGLGLCAVVPGTAHADPRHHDHRGPAWGWENRAWNRHQHDARQYWRYRRPVVVHQVAPQVVYAPPVFYAPPPPPPGGLNIVVPLYIR